MKSATLTFVILVVAVALFPHQGTGEVLKIATLPPDGTAWMKEIRKRASEIEQRTSGRVQFKFYPGGVMGNDASVLRKMRIGQLHGGGIASGALASIYPDSQTYGLPMLFRSYDEVDYVRARMDEHLMKGLEQRGFVSFGIAESGFAYLMSSRPIRGVQDLEGVKAWVPEGDPISRTFFEAAGRAPIPLPVSDVLTGLQTGLIEAVGTPPIGAIALQWHTAVKYLTEIPVMYTYGFLLFDRRAFNRNGREDQKIMRTVLERGFMELNKQNRKDNDNAKQALRNQGITFVQPSPEESKHLRAIATNATKRLQQTGIYSPAVLDSLVRHLRAYRKGHDGAAK